MTSLDPFYEFRGQMVARLKRDLLGPREEEEELEDLPLDHYVVGVLYPRIGDTIDPAEDDELGEDEDEPTVADPPVALANTRYPSSAGLTFAVDTAACDRLLVDVEAARYVPLENENGRRWRRSPSALRDLEVEVSRPISGRWLELEEGLALFVKVREVDDEGAASVTLTLVNTREASAGQRDVDAFFQPSISVRASDDSAAFVARRSRAADVDDADLRSYRLLYRHAKTFAIGHGCAADWGREDVADRATRVFTTFLPQHELLLADSNPAIQSLALGLKFLATGDRGDVLGALTHFCGLYQEWIEARAEEIHLLPAGLQTTAAEHITACRECLSRMRSGIDELDGEVWTAFQLANLAMWNQRTRATWIRAGKPTPEPIADDTPQWRPFQLAFILQCLRGLAEPSHEDREIADLLWFPTGGGKTEAYLGLIAFTVFLRRLRSTDGDGVTVLMRYTLRLLTLQQFERAALLISACEQIRRAREDLGGSEISIGLWIGQAGTPNTLADARTALTNLRDGREVLEGNPLQLRSCPWCGSELGAFQYEITTEPRMLIRCRDKTCEFARGLPVYLVDEDVYRRRPTLVIATVDKFATMPWRQETAALFNRRSASPPPELIVQDELHLISGPLGTLAGLYETAVDLLCTERGIPPKVVASTATIRRAEEQARGLFMRAMRQFPPPGLDARRLVVRRRGARRRQRNPTLHRCDGARKEPRHAHDPRLRLAAAVRLRDRRRRSGPGPVLDARRLLQQPPRTRRSPDAGTRRCARAAPARRRRRRPARPRARQPDRADQPRELRGHPEPSCPHGDPAARPGHARRDPRHEHDLRRSRHRPTRSDGHDGSAPIRLGVHPGHQPGRTRLSRADRDAAERRPEPRPIALRGVQDISLGALPPSRIHERDPLLPTIA